MSRVIAAFAQFFDDQGDPVENGWLRFLVSATNNTDKETYSDANQTVANANPLQLDAAGRCPNVFGQGKYRVVLFENNPVTNLPGSQLAEFDPVFAQVITESAGENFSEWDVDVTYEVGSIVSYQHSYYRSFTSGNLGNFPDSSPTQWEQISFLRYYNPSVSYYTDDIVVYNSQFYFSLADANQGNQPDISPAWWDALGSGTILTNWEENGTDFRPTAAGYNIGDAVNYVGTMYLDAFGIFPETPAALPTADYEVANKLYVDTLRDDVMKWQGEWVPGTYETYDVVRDDQWTMIANTTTIERAAPQNSGDAFWVRDLYSPPALSSTSASENVLYIGQRYLYVSAFLNTNIRIYFPAAAIGMNVEVWAVVDPTGDKYIFNIVPQKTLTATDVDKWVELNLEQSFVPKNTTVDFIMVVRPSTGATTFTHEWVYSKADGDPAAGEINHQSSNLDQIRVHEQDNTLTDRTSELDNIGPGSTIYMDASDYTWEVLQASKTGDVYSFTVDPGARAADATTDFTFQYLASTSINYVYNTNLYASESRISGYFANEYEPTNAAYINDNGYGLDIQIQNVITSADWEVVATPPGFGFISSAGGGGSGLTYWEEVGDIFRPVTTKVGQLGDATHLIESLFVMDSGVIYLGDSQDLELFHDGTDSWLENNTGDLYLQNSSANSIFLIANSNSWEIASNGDIIPDTTAAYDFGSTSFRIDKGWFTSLEITNIPTINGADFITTVLPSQVGHTGEFLQTDGAGNLSWAVAGGGGTTLVYWEENIDTFRPKTTKVGQLGDSTHLIELVYLMSDGFIYFGDSQEASIQYYSSANTLYLASANNMDLDVGFNLSIAVLSDCYFDITGDTYFNVNPASNFNFQFSSTTYWQISNTGAILVGASNPLADIGDTTNRVNKLWAVDAEFTNTPTIGGADFITTVLPSQATHAGEFLQTDGAGTLSWVAAGGGSLTAWEENGNDLRPVTTKVSDLGDPTHLLVYAYICDGGRLYFGDGQDFSIYHDGLSAYLTNMTGSLYFETPNNILFRTNSTNQWILDTTGAFRPVTTNTVDIGTTSLRVKKGWFVDGEFTNTPTIGSADFITTVLPAQATHSGEYLQTDGAGTLSWAAVSALSSWEESSDDLRPVVSGTGNLGDSTHLIEGAYFNDNATINLGTSQDIRIYHDSTNSYIENRTGVFNIGTFSALTLQFYTNSINQWAIQGTGELVPGTAGAKDIGTTALEVRNIYQSDSGHHYLGSDQDMDIYHSGSVGYIYNGTGVLRVGTTAANAIYFDVNSTTRWTMDSSGHLVPSGPGVYNIGSTAAEVNHIYQADSAIHYFGSDQDLEIYHDGSNGYIVNNTGQVFINGEVLGTGLKCVSFYYEGTAQDEDYIVIDSTSGQGFRFDEDVTITDITIHARVAPTGASLIVYPIKNETEIGASSATLTSGSYIAKTDIADITITADTDRFGLIIKQIGSTEPGQGITVVVHYSNN